MCFVVLQVRAAIASSGADDRLAIRIGYVSHSLISTIKANGSGSVAEGRRDTMKECGRAERGLLVRVICAALSLLSSAAPEVKSECGSTKPTSGQEHGQSKCLLRFQLASAMQMPICLSAVAAVTATLSGESCLEVEYSLVMRESVLSLHKELLAGMSEGCFE